MEITQERLKYLLEYEPETGLFRNRVDRRGSRGRVAVAGDYPGSVNEGYLSITLDGRSYRAHRLAWMYISGEFPPCQIDHIDGNRLNNRASNLRSCNQSENNENMSKWRSDTTSKHVGVCFYARRNKWVAQVRKDGKAAFRYCKTEREAVIARDEMKKSLHRFNPVQREAA